MKHTKKMSIILIAVFLSACSNLKPQKHISSVLKGTNTVIVGIYLDSKGYPQANMETIRVAPEQKIIFAGPDKFDIFFKDQKSPSRETEVRSSNGVIIIEIPKDIFEREQRTTKATMKVDEILYRYGIRANGKETDPHISVCRC